MNALVDKAEELGDDLRDSAKKLIMRAAAPTLFRGTIYGLASKALMQYLQSRAAHAEGNGASLHNPEWGEMRGAASTPPNVS